MPPPRKPRHLSRLAASRGSSATGLPCALACEDRNPQELPMATTKEHVRLEEARTGTAAWKKWGPYLSERQWGTVREDYSETGDAWNFFTHDHARSRAYR